MTCPRCNAETPMFFPQGDGGFSCPHCQGKPTPTAVTVDEAMSRGARAPGAKGNKHTRDFPAPIVKPSQPPEPLLASPSPELLRHMEAQRAKNEERAAPRRRDAVITLYITNPTPEQIHAQMSYFGVAAKSAFRDFAISWLLELGFTVIPPNQP